jgi:CubicO group peptidase (beta-lactamase class C family)
METKLIWALLPAVLLKLCCFAQSAPAERIDSFLRVMSEHQLFNGSILVAKEGKVIYQRSYGYWDRAGKIPNSDTTAVNLASVSKPFTSLAVLQLVAKGKIRLDDPYSRYFPDFPYPAVTIRQLLSHTSGLPKVEDFERPYIDQHPDEVLTDKEVYAHLLALKQPLLFQSGAKWDYSNFGYTCLALLVERVSKMPFGDYMRKYIFLPAGMGHTYVRAAGTPNTPRYIIPAIYMTEYKNVDSLDHRKFYTFFNLGGIAGCGNVVSTLDDLFRFDQALSAGKLVPAWLMDTAFTPIKLNDGKVFHLRGKGAYGLGWNVIDDPVNDTIVYHDGHITGIKTLLYRDLSKHLTIIYYDNMESPIPLDIVGTIARILGGRELRRLSLAKSLARVYGAALVSGGVDAAMTIFDQLKDDSVHYYVDERELNTLGYELLGNSDIVGHNELSLEVFKINTLLYHNANSYDSYAEALMRSGKNEEAIGMYQKSLSLEPHNPVGARRLAELLKKKD